MIGTRWRRYRLTQKEPGDIRSVPTKIVVEIRESEPRRAKRYGNGYRVLDHGATLCAPGDTRWVAACYFQDGTYRQER